MSRFKRASVDKDTIHAEWWDEGVLPDGTKWKEEVVLKPSMSFGTQQRAAKASMNPPDSISIEQLQAAKAMQLLKWTDQIMMNRILLGEQITSWTFRTDPTPEQEEAGLPGDIVLLCQAAIDELEGADVQFIVDEINKRTGGKKADAESAKPEFRPDVPNDSTTEGAEGLPAGNDSISSS